MKHINILLICIIFSYSTSAQNSFYIDINGNNNNKGTIESSLLDINNTIKKIRKERKKGNKEHFTIYLREGEYIIDETIQFEKEDSLITLSAYPNEEVKISGAKHIPKNKIKSVINSPFEHLFDTNKQQFIHYFELDQNTNLENIGFGKKMQLAWNQLIINDTLAQIAQYPNHSMILIDSVFLFNKVKEQYEWTIIDKLPSNQMDNAFVEGCFNKGWSIETVPVHQYDDKMKKLTIHSKLTYGAANGKPWQRFRILNTTWALDENFEYIIYKQGDKSILFFYYNHSFNNIKINNSDNILCQLDGSSNIKIKDIHFSNTRNIGIHLFNTQNCTIDNCQIYQIGNIGVFFGSGSANKHHHLFEEKYLSEDIDIQTKGGFNNIIKNCEIYDIGATGIVLSGGYRKSLNEGNNMVENCHIHHITKINKGYQGAINILGVGNKIRHCKIHDANMMAIYIKGNNHLLEYNNIYQTCLMVHDMGSIYQGRNPSARGTIIRYNYIHHIPNHFETVGIYLDDAISDITINGNILLDAGRIAVFIGGGSDNHLFNNLIIHGNCGIFIDNRLENWFSSLLDDGGVFHQKLNEVNYQSDIYTKTYPSLKNFWENHPEKPKNNLIEKNIFCDLKLLFGKGKEFIILENNRFVSNFPYSWTEKMGDNQFIPIDTWLPLPDSWENIPIHKIGIQKTTANK